LPKKHQDGKEANSPRLARRTKVNYYCCNTIDTNLKGAIGALGKGWSPFGILSIIINHFSHPRTETQSETAKARINARIAQLRELLPKEDSTMKVSRFLTSGAPNN